MKNINLLKKLSLLVLIVGIFVGTTTLIITGIKENYAKKRAHNSLLNQIIDLNYDIQKYNNLNNYEYNSETGEYYYVNDDESQTDSKTILDSYYDMSYSFRYSPYYFTGWFIIFLSVGASITLFVIAKVKENNQNQANSVA